MVMTDSVTQRNDVRPARRPARTARGAASRHGWEGRRDEARPYLHEIIRRRELRDATPLNTPERATACQAIESARDAALATGMPYGWTEDTVFGDLDRLKEVLQFEG